MPSAVHWDPNLWSACVPPVPKSRASPFVPGSGKNASGAESIQTLRADFKSAQLAENVAILASRGFESWRRIRGDGSCFYRACIVGALEVAIGDSSTPQSTSLHHPDLIERWIRAGESACTPAAKPFVLYLKELLNLRQHVPQNFFEVVQESAIDMDLPIGLCLREALIANLTCNDAVDKAAVAFCRQMVANFVYSPDGRSIKTAIGSLEDLLSATLDMTTAEFTRNIILKEGVEAEEPIPSVLISQALGIRVRVVLLESSNPPTAHGHKGEADMQFTIHILLKPGHYDCLNYSKVGF